MRILHFYKTYFPDTIGGIEQAINQLCRSTVKYGVESSVLSLSRDKVERTINIDGHIAHRARMDFEIASTAFSASVFLRFSQLAKQADIVHYHFPWPFMDLVHFTTRLKKPTVLTYHSDIVRQKTLLKFYRPLQHQFLTSIDRIVATSPNYFATSEVLNKYRDKTVVIPIGLDKSTYPVPSCNVFAKWKSQFGKRFFLFVGMLRYYKGLHILLDAIQGTTYPVVIVGSGPIEAKLKKHADLLGIRNVVFLGMLSDEDKSALLQLCYAVVFPSHMRSEAFGISLLEGAMYGKPMISSEIGTGTSFINQNDETGLVVPPDDPQSLRIAMDHLWNNPNIATKMGIQAYKRYSELFTAEKMAESYIEIYTQLLLRN